MASRASARVFLALARAFSDHSSKIAFNWSFYSIKAVRFS